MLGSLTTRSCHSRSSKMRKSISLRVASPTCIPKWRAGKKESRIALRARSAAFAKAAQVPCPGAGLHSYSRSNQVVDQIASRSGENTKSTTTRIQDASIRPRVLTNHFAAHLFGRIQSNRPFLSSSAVIGLRAGSVCVRVAAERVHGWNRGLSDNDLLRSQFCRDMKLQVLKSRYLEWVSDAPRR